MYSKLCEIGESVGKRRSVPEIHPSPSLAAASAALFQGINFPAKRGDREGRNNKEKYPRITERDLSSRLRPLAKKRRRRRNSNFGGLLPSLPPIRSSKVRLPERRGINEEGDLVPNIGLESRDVQGRLFLRFGPAKYFFAFRTKTTWLGSRAFRLTKNSSFGPRPNASLLICLPRSIKETIGHVAQGQQALLDRLMRRLSIKVPSKQMRNFPLS